MAEIPVEKKSGIPGWVWLLLALLLLALLLWWLLDDDDDVEAIEEPIVATDTVLPAAATGLIVGEAIDWDNVRVTELNGDMAFTVEHEGNMYPVFFDQVPTPGTPTEGIYDINPGMILDIEGEVRSATDTLPENADPTFLGDNENYIFATEIEPQS